MNADYSKALEEMMKRIKDGKLLKATQRPADRRVSCSSLSAFLYDDDGDDDDGDYPS